MRQFLPARRVSGIGQKRILPTKPKISRLITRRLIECRSFRALSLRSLPLLSRSRRRSSASSSRSLSFPLLPVPAASPHFTPPHLISSRTDNFSLSWASPLSFRRPFSPVAQLPCQVLLPPHRPSTFSVSPNSALMRTSFSNHVHPPPPLSILLLLRFLLHLLLVLLLLLLLVSFIFMQW